MSYTYAVILGFSLSDWWGSATRELNRYFTELDTAGWGIIASLFVVAGFLLLRTGSPQR